MITVYLSLGSNLGHREQMIEDALREIDELDRTHVVRVSALYDTEPVGVLDQPRFLNAVTLIETELEPRRLLWNLKLVERRLGRVPSRRWGPRAIDIDILLYGEAVIRGPDLAVPHPRLRERAFVLAPLTELAPDLEHPETGERLAELAGALADQGAVRRLGRLSF